MRNDFARWFASALLLSTCAYDSSLVCQELDSCDTALVLPDDQSERFVSLTGVLHLKVLDRDPGNGELDAANHWVLNMSPESLEVACSTPVRASFQSPDSIRASSNCNELALTGGFNEKWLREHVDETVTLSGYLWHAHTAHHLTPVMMDTDPWFK